jgi:hypothetical protein
MTILPATLQRRNCPNRQQGEPNFMVGGAPESAVTLEMLPPDEK